MRYLVLLLLAGCFDEPTKDDMMELRKRVAVQGVQLDDARDRIHVLEMDLDRIAPHTIRSTP